MFTYIWSSVCEDILLKLLLLRILQGSGAFVFLVNLHSVLQSDSSYFPSPRFSPCLRFCNFAVLWFGLHIFNVLLWLVQVSSSSFLRSTGSSRRAVVSSSRDAVIMATESDAPLSRIADASPGTLQKISSGQRSSPVLSSENKHSSSGRNTSNIKNFESTLRGIESLQFQ